MDHKKRLMIVALCLILFALWGCASMGPKTVVQDRSDYTGALGDSWKQQTGGDEGAPIITVPAG